MDNRFLREQSPHAGIHDKHKEVVKVTFRNGELVGVPRSVRMFGSFFTTALGLASIKPKLPDAAEDVRSTLRYRTKRSKISAASEMSRQAPRFVAECRNSSVAFFCPE